MKNHPDCQTLKSETRTSKTVKRTLLLRTKHSMRIFELTPFTDLKHSLTVVWVSFCSLIKGITPTIRMLCFVLINSSLLNLLCVSILSNSKYWFNRHPSSNQTTVADYAVRVSGNCQLPGRLSLAFRWRCVVTDVSSSISHFFYNHIAYDITNKTKTAAFESRRQ